MLQRNTFQCVLATDGLQSFIIFLYPAGLIQWTTGDIDASEETNGFGGGPAVAGYDANDGENFFNIPGSGTDDIINVTRTSNVGNPGTWIFSTTLQQQGMQSKLPILDHHTCIVGQGFTFSPQGKILIFAMHL